MSARLKTLSILAILAFLVSLLPTLVASAAVAGTITLDETAYTADEVGDNVVTVTVTDTDLNVALVLPGSCTSIFTFKCELVGIGGETTVTGGVAGLGYQVHASHTPIKDRNGDDIPDSVISRGLQEQKSFFLFTGSSAGGTVRFSEATTGPRFQSKTGGTVGVSDDITAGTLTTQLTNFAKIEFVISSAASAVLDTSGILVTGTSVDPVTLAETTGDTEVIIAAGSLSDGTNRSTKWWKTIDSYRVDHASGTFDLEIFELYTVALGFEFDVLDATGDVNLSSTSDPAGLDLTLVETTMASGVFSKKVGLIDADKQATITALGLADTALIGPVGTSGTLLFELDALGTDDGDAAHDWVAAAVTKGVVANGDTVADLKTASLTAAHGDTLTATYDDQAPAATDTNTAIIDGEEPVISGIAPAKDSDTNDTLPDITVTFVDPDSGLDDTTVSIVTTGFSVGAAQKTGVTDGLIFKWAPNAVLADGSYSFRATIEDAVGNVADTGVVDFTVDTGKPRLSTLSGEEPQTGVGVKLDVDDDDKDGKTDDYIEFRDPGWIKVTFSEDLDQTSVAQEKFDVTGSSTPNDAVAVSKVCDLASVAAATSTNPCVDVSAVRFVYLAVDDLAADATPTIEVLGPILDPGGNSQTTGEAVAVDFIAPTAALSLSAILGAENEVITVTAAWNEPLRIASTIVVTNLESCNTPGDITSGGCTVTTATMARVDTTDTYTYDFTIDDSAVYTVEVIGVDKSTLANGGTADDEFEGDLTPPAVSIAAVGEVAAGAVWIEFTFTEGNEYANDTTYTNVTVTGATLNLPDGTVEDVLAELFPTGKATKFTLARTLVEGEYEASITGEDDAGNSVTATDTIAVTPAADLAVAKADAPDPVTMGNNLTYTVTITNNGLSDAIGVTLTDILPVGTTFVSATATQGSCSESGGTVTCNLGSLANSATATVTIVVTPTAAGTPSNTASVAGNEFDPDTGNNTATESATVHPEADLAVAKADSPDPVMVGSNLTYTVTVTNNGPSDATGITLTDTLPAGVTFVLATATQGSCSESGSTLTCDLGALINGGTVTVTIVVAATTAGIASNSAVVTGNGFDPDTANNIATENTMARSAAPTSTPTPIGFEPPPIIAPEGGSTGEISFDVGAIIMSPDEQVTVTVQSGSVPGIRNIAYAPSTAADVPALPAGSGFSFGSKVFSLTMWDELGTPLEGFSFFRPITITVKYTDDDVATAGGNPYNLEIMYYDTSLDAWTGLLTTIDLVAKTATARVTHLTAFALVAQQPVGAPTLTPTSKIETTPPIVGGVAPSSGFLVGLLIVAIVLIASGTYYLRQTAGRLPQ